MMFIRHQKHFHFIKCISVFPSRLYWLCILKEEHWTQRERERLVPRESLAIFTASCKRGEKVSKLFLYLHALPSVIVNYVIFLSICNIFYITLNPQKPKANLSQTSIKNIRSRLRTHSQISHMILSFTIFHSLLDSSTSFSVMIYYVHGKR